MLGGGILFYVASFPPDQFNAAHDSITIGLDGEGIHRLLGLGGERLTMAERSSPLP